MSSGATSDIRKYFLNALLPLLTQDSNPLHFLREMFFIGSQLLILIHEAFTLNHKPLVLGSKLCYLCSEQSVLMHRNFKIQLCMPPRRQTTLSMCGAAIGKI